MTFAQLKRVSRESALAERSGLGVNSIIIDDSSGMAKTRYEALMMPVSVYVVS